MRINQEFSFKARLAGFEPTAFRLGVLPTLVCICRFLLDFAVFCRRKLGTMSISVGLSRPVSMGFISKLLAC